MHGQNKEINMKEYISVSINGKEKNRIPFEDAIKRNMTEIIKDVTKDIQEFSIRINGRRPLPRCIKSMKTNDVETIEIFEATINPS